MIILRERARLKSERFNFKMEKAFKTVFGHLNPQPLPLPKLQACRYETLCVFQQSGAEFPQRLVVSRDLIQNRKSFTSTS